MDLFRGIVLRAMSDRRLNLSLSTTLCYSLILSELEFVTFLVVVCNSDVNVADQTSLLLFLQSAIHTGMEIKMKLTEAAQLRPA